MAEFEVKIGAQQIYEKLVSVDTKLDQVRSDQAVTNAKLDMRITALERAANRGWQFWLALIGGGGGLASAVIMLFHH